MSSAVLADLVVLVHLAFIVFVACGALLLAFWPRMIWLHLPAAAWGAVVEFSGWPCPLTSLEVRLRQDAGESGYRGDFIEQSIASLLYPTGLTRGVQFALGAFVLGINVLIYGWLWRRRLGSRRPGSHLSGHGRRA